MSRRYLVMVSILAVVVVVAATVSASAQDQSGYTPPRTAWGDPVIDGVFTTSTLTPLERPEELGMKEFYTQEEFDAIVARRRQPVETITEEERDRGERADVHYDFAEYGLVAGQNEFSPNLRTSIIVDPPNGRIPPQVEGARRGRAAPARQVPDDGGPETRSLTERCIIWSSTMAPILPGGYNSNMQIFQAPGYVVIQAEMGDARVVPTDGRPITDSIPQWNGSSVGHWEGDTLVVETSNFTDDAPWRGSGAGRKVTERFKRTSDSTVEYGFTVEDPETWTEPWSGVYPLTEIEGPLYEYACHEGNYGLPNILAGLRAEEAAAATSAQ